MADRAEPRTGAREGACPAAAAPVVVPRARIVAAAVREARLDPSYARAVDEMIDEDDDAWPGCCGSSCDPCVLTLATTARRARELLRAAEAPARPLADEATPETTAAS